MRNKALKIACVLNNIGGNFYIYLLMVVKKPFAIHIQLSKIIGTDFLLANNPVFAK